MDHSDAPDSGDTPTPRLVKVKEAARLLGIGRSKTYELIRGGDLEAVAIGRSRLVPVDAIDDFVARLRDEASYS